MSGFELDPKFIAGVDMLKRVGAVQFTIGHTAEEDHEPPLWWAHVKLHERLGGHCEASAAIGPVGAVLRLCERLIDGGACAHCGQLTIFDDNPSDSPFDALLDALGCVYAWDPELKTFRRGCEGG